MNAKPMDNHLLQDVTNRLLADYGFKQTGGEWLRAGRCPVCGKKELYTHAHSPWVIKCGRESKCAAQWHVKDLYQDLFEDWSKRAPATASNPTATARAYLEFNRGFDLGLCGTWFSQESYYDQATGQSSATVRFTLEKGGWWERIIDRPSRFDKKARFKFGESFQGRWWKTPTVNLETTKEIWIVEGIFDAIALAHHGIDAVSAMSCNVFPRESLQDLLQQRAGNLPRIVWALDNEEGKVEGKGARGYVKRWVRETKKLGFVTTAALLPQPDRKLDWNDAHQRWVFIEDLEQRKALINKTIKEARFEGAVLLSESAEEKGFLLYEHKPKNEFHFEFGRRWYWFKFNLDKYNEAMQRMEDDNHPDSRLSDKEKRRKALQETGGVKEIANCHPQFLYYQENKVNPDESRYYARINFPHSGSSKKVTFSGSQMASATDFKKRLLHLAPGAVFSGTSPQLEKIIQDELFNPKIISTIDFIGYSKEHETYVFNNVAINNGRVTKLNEEDYFEFDSTRLKTTQTSVAMSLNMDGEEYNQDWFKHLWNAFGEKGIIALAFWYGSIFCEQIRAEHEAFPFLEVTGEQGAGKTTLINFLWKLFGRDYEGFDPSTSTPVGRANHFAQVASMPIVLMEGDREKDSRGPSRSDFNFDELKKFLNGGTIRTRGVYSAGNETYEPPFRATICISQNAAVDGSKAIRSRIVKMHFSKKPHVPADIRNSVKQLTSSEQQVLSHFLVKSAQFENMILDEFSQLFSKNTDLLCTYEDLGESRIRESHAMMMALVTCLKHVTPINQQQIEAAHTELLEMCHERHLSVQEDHPSILEFWEVYDYLENKGDRDSRVNHSVDSSLIAINMNEFYQKASEHRQNLPDLKTMRTLLLNGQKHPLVAANKSTFSKIRSEENKRNPCSNVPNNTRCWIFKV